MKIKHQELTIPQEKPFANCKLNREPYAKVLTSIVNSYAEGFVMTINNEWGAGKTTFVKMWEQHLKNEGFQTIYFNAWENDFDSNPLVALMAELKTLTKRKNNKAFNSVIKKGAVLVTNVTPALLRAVANRYLDSTVITEAIENTTKATAEILEEEIKEYASKKKTIVEFKNELAKFIKQDGNTKPLIYIIDELDRCRPNYAVEVLEQIKHFFTVPGIVFVLSIDKKHLASSVKGFYGSEEINSNEYLRRFIDLEYSIPPPSTKNFVKYLYEYYSFDEFLSSQERVIFPELQNDSANLLITAEYLFTKANSTLRQQERIFAFTRLVLCSFKVNEYAFPHLLFVLIYLKVTNDTLFNRIERNMLSVQELSNSFGSLLSPSSSDGEKLDLGSIEALLLWFYNNNRENNEKIKLLNQENDGRPTTTIKSTLSYPYRSLAEYFGIIDRQRYDHLKLDFLLKKINLTEPVITIS